jgi:outer membrane protein OmpA-like peptidoglycan-associated protein
MSLPINTDNVEMSPFLASDGVTLYFASNRPGGFGSNDIWMTRRLDDTWQKWSEPVNLGAGVNTPQWDSYYSIAASGDCAYMVSYANTYGHSDIVRISLRKEVRPNPVALVSGRVLDKKTGKPVEASISFTTLSDGKEAGTARTTPGTGDYQIILPYGKLYGFSASAQGYYAVSENLDLSNLKSYEEVKRDLYLVPIEVGQVVRLNNIFFEFGKDSLKAESFPELDKVVQLLTDNAAMTIALSGHTDNVGSDAANLKLSEGRAKAVYNYLVSKGIDASRLSSKGYGETKPVATNDTEDGRQQNRRVEFEIEKK